jgi:hypothetical protein
MLAEGNTSPAPMMHENTHLADGLGAHGHVAGAAHIRALRAHVVAPAADARVFLRRRERVLVSDAPDNHEGVAEVLVTLPAPGVHAAQVNMQRVS